jgi:O-antigen/teichoic acid export membrane protein
MAHAGYGVWSLIYSVLAGQFLQVLLYFPKMNRIPQLRFSLAPLREALRFGLTVMASTVLQYFRSRSGILIVGIFLGERQTGYYQYANSLAQLPSEKVGQIFRRIAFPSFANIRSEPELLKQTIVSLHRALLLISIPTLGGLAIVSDDMVTVFLTEKWRPMVPLLQLLCVYNLFEISERILPSAIESTGRAGEVFKYHLASLLIVGAAMLLGAQRSAGWMLAYSLAIYPLLYASLLRRALAAMQMSWMAFLAPLMPVVMINVIMFAAVILVKALFGGEPAWIRLTACVATGGLVYALLLARTFGNELRGTLRTLRNA